MNKLLLSLSVALVGIQCFGEATIAYQCRAGKMKSLQELEAIVSEFSLSDELAKFPYVKLTQQASVFCRLSTTEKEMSCMAQVGLPGQPGFSPVAEVVAPLGVERLALRNIKLAGVNKRYGVFCDRIEPNAQD